MVRNQTMNEEFNNLIKRWINKTLQGKGDSDGHLLTLFTLALASKAKAMVELGVRDGTSTLPLLAAAALTNGHLYSVDKEPVNFDIPDKLKTYWSFDQNNSLSFLKTWPTEKIIDLVYLDDWHAYEHVKAELKLIDPLVSPSSLILIHDTMYGNTQPFYHTDLTLKNGQWAEGGPYRAVAEMDMNFWEWSTLPWNNGLTILRKKYSSLYHTK